MVSNFLYLRLNIYAKNVLKMLEKFFLKTVDCDFFLIVSVVNNDEIRITIYEKLHFFTYYNIYLKKSLLKL